MGSPADPRILADLTSRLFTPAEANALVSRLQEIFERLDAKLARLREVRELIEDAESYFGGELATAPAEDRRRHADLLETHADLERSVQADVDEVHSFGCEVKDVHRGLVDFPAFIGEEVAYLCWQRGERRIAWWHTLEGGFAGRKALAPQAER